MDFKDLPNIKWDKESLSEFRDFLKSLGDKKYADFNAKIIPDRGKTYGVRNPDLKKVEKSFKKSQNAKELYEILDGTDIYDEKLLRGFLVSKIQFNSSIEMFDCIDSYIKCINNWALCDSFVGSLKNFVKKNKDEFYKKIKIYLKSENEWERRFGLILLNGYFKEEKYIEDIFSILPYINTDEYYVKMGMSWLISTLYLTDKNKTIEFLKERKIEKWCINKSIQKIRESYRVPDEDKEFLKTLKVK